MKRFGRKLRRAMLIYALVFAALLGAGLYVLHGYLSAYEASRPIHVVRAFQETVTEEEVARLAETTLSGMRDRENSGREAVSRLKEIVRQAEPARSRGGQDGGTEVYVLQYGTDAIGRLVLLPEGKDRFGFTEYRVSTENFDFSPFFCERRVTVPSDWSVLCNGSVLDASSIVEDGIPYALLREFYGEEGLALPSLVTYSSGLCLDEPEFEVLDAQGLPVPEPDEESFTDNCSEGEREAAAEAAERFLREYVKFSSNTDNSAEYHFSRLKTMVVPDSALEKRLAAAVSGLKYARSKSDELLELTFDHVMALGDGCYLCDMSYVIQTEGMGSTVTETYHMKLVLKNSDGTGLRVLLLESC